LICFISRPRESQHSESGKRPPPLAGRPVALPKIDASHSIKLSPHGRSPGWARQAAGATSIVSFFTAAATAL
jgi:hypothetical protein